MGIAPVRKKGGKGESVALRGALKSTGKNKAENEVKVKREREREQIFLPLRFFPRFSQPRPLPPSASSFA